MTPERWRQVKEVLHEALERDPGGRTVFLDETCAGDPALRTAVEVLLAQQETAPSHGDATAAPGERGATGPGQALPRGYGAKYCPRCQQPYPAAQRVCAKDGELLFLRDPYHLVGRVLAGKYRIEALVGVGGMGAVYSAHHLGIDRRVAFKVLLPNLALGNPHLVGLFEREAKMAGHLSHENIANVFDAGQAGDGLAYIAMEWLDGQTLAEELAESGPLSLARAGEILRQVCAALETAHAAHIIHRDLKPANVMLAPRRGGSERVKILDFGIAKAVTDTAAGTPVSSMMGTPHYASPEQFEVGGKIDSRADIYSLGVMLYQMLTGALPFEAVSIRELIQLHLTTAPPPLRKLRPDAPAAVEQLVQRMLAKSPEQRPQRAAEVCELYADALGNPEIAPVCADVAVPRARARWRRPAWLAAAALALAAVGLFAARYWRGRVDPAAARSLAFVGFENRTPNRELDGLGRVAPALLAARLARVPGLEVAGDREVFDALRGLGLQPGETLDRAQARAAAGGAGAGAVVTGAVSASDGRLRLEVRVEELARGGEVFAGAAEGARPEEVYGMVDQLADRIAAAYGLEAGGGPRAADLTTRSYEALRLYRAGYDRLLLSDPEGAIAPLDKAAKIDPGYALAHLRLGQAYERSRRAEAREAYAQAHELRERAGEPDRLLIEAHYQRFVERDRARSAALFEELLARDPKHAEALLALINFNRETHQFDRALEFGRRALAVNPRFSAAWNAVGYTHLLRHDYGNAIDAFKRCAEIDPRDANAPDSLGDTYTEAQIFDDALRAYERVFELRPDFFDYAALWKMGEVHFLKGDGQSAGTRIAEFLGRTGDARRPLGYQTLARIDLYQGRLGAARGNFARARAAAARAGDRLLEADVMIREAYLLTGLRRYDEALRQIIEARRLAPERLQLGLGARLTALSLKGEGELARAELAAVGAGAPASLAAELRARAAQSSGDYAAAVPLWRSLKEQQPGITSRAYELAVSLLGAGQPAEAERELRALVKARPVPDLGSTSPINPLYDTRYILAHYELGRAAEALNRPAQATEAYLQFLAYWGGGEITLDEIAKAREKVKTLK